MSAVWWWKLPMLGVGLIITAGLISTSILGAACLVPQKYELYAEIGSGALDIAEICFMIGFVHFLMEGDKPFMATLCCALWLGLSSCTIYAAQSWSIMEIAEKDKPVADSDRDIAAAEKHVTDTTANTLSPNWRIQNAANIELPKAKEALKKLRKEAPHVSIQHVAKGHEWQVMLMFMVVAHSCFLIVFGHGHRTEEQRMRLWARGRGRSSGQDRPKGTPARPDRPQDGQDRTPDRSIMSGFGAKRGGSRSDDYDDNGAGERVIPFRPQKAVKKPSKADVLSLIDAGWSQIAIAEFYKISDRTVRRYVRERKDFGGEGLRMAGALV